MALVPDRRCGWLVSSPDPPRRRVWVRDQRLTYPRVSFTWPDRRSGHARVPSLASQTQTTSARIALSITHDTLGWGSCVWFARLETTHVYQIRTLVVSAWIVCNPPCLCSDIWTAPRSELASALSPAHSQREYRLHWNSSEPDQDSEFSDLENKVCRMVRGPGVSSGWVHVYRTLSYHRLYYRFFICSWVTMFELPDNSTWVCSYHSCCWPVYVYMYKLIRWGCWDASCSGTKL